MLILDKLLWWRKPALSLPYWLMGIVSTPLSRGMIASTESPWASLQSQLAASWSLRCRCEAQVLAALPFLKGTTPLVPQLPGAFSPASRCSKAGSLVPPMGRALALGQDISTWKRVFGGRKVFKIDAWDLSSGILNCRVLPGHQDFCKVSPTETNGHPRVQDP